MVSTRKLVLAFSLLAMACGGKPRVDRGLSVSPEKLSGRFAMVPSATQEEIRFKEDGLVEMKSEESSAKGLYALDASSLRFRFENGDYGIFLRSAFHPREWRGFYRGEVRILKRLEGAKNLDRSESDGTTSKP